MNRLMDWYRKLKDLIGHGRTGAFIRGFLFINGSVLIGIWLGMKVFLPDDFILAKINERLFVKDMGLVAEDVDVSILGNISIYEGALTEKGEKTTSFYELQFRPSFFHMLFGELSGTVVLSDINNQGGELELSFETGENPCYYIDLEEVPLSVFKPFLKDISLIGELSGEAEVCNNEKNYDGFVELAGKDIVFRGKVPTQMGPLNIGKIDIGKVTLVSDISKSVVSVNKFLTEGLFSIDIAGKINLNAKSFDASRINLDVRMKAPDVKKIEKNPTLNLAIGQMSKYKKDKENYAFLLKGRLFQPKMYNAPDKRPEDSADKNKKSKTKDRKIKRKSRNKPVKRTPRKRERTKLPEKRKEIDPRDRKSPPKRKKNLIERGTTTKLEDDIDEDRQKKEKKADVEKEEEKEKEEVEKEVEVEKEEVEKEEDAPEGEEVEKEKKEELPDKEKKEEKSNDEEDEEK